MDWKMKNIIVGAYDCVMLFWLSASLFPVSFSLITFGEETEKEKVKISQEAARNFLLHFQNRRRVRREQESCQKKSR